MGIQVSEVSRGPKAEINVVPLIDILLVLVIIFMVITPMASSGLKALLPQRGHDPGAPVPKVVVVQLGAEGTVRINAHAETWETLGARLAVVFRGRAEKVAFLQADGPVEFAQVARAMDIMHDAGIENVGLLTPRALLGP